MHRLFITTVLILLHFSLHSQSKYLCTVDKTSGLISKINRIPNLKSYQTGESAIDNLNSNYTFIGVDSSNTSRLFTLDLSNGSILSNPQFPQGLSQFSGISSLEYNHQTGMLYGILYDGQTSLNHLVTINPISGTHTLIDTISGIQGILSGSINLDSQNNQYIFVGLDMMFNEVLYSLDASTGNVVYSPTLNKLNRLDGFSHLELDSSNLTVRGFYWRDSIQSFIYFATDKQNGILSFIDTLNSIDRIISFHTSYSANLNEYYILIENQNSQTEFYTLDANTASINHSPAFPMFTDTSDFISDLHYSSATNTIYGLFHDNMISTGNSKLNSHVNDINIYPNPTSHTLILEHLSHTKNSTIRLVNSQGIEVISKTANNSFIELDVSYLKDGFYFLFVESKNNKIVKKVHITK